MTKTFKTLKSLLLASMLLLLQIPHQVLAIDLQDEPMRIRDLESMFINTIIAVWVLSIPYFMFVIGSIGAQWMLSGGDEQKLAGLKKRGGNVALSFALVFGGYIVVKLIISLLGLKSPGGTDCFTSPFGGSAIFQFFFPEACGG